jgi:hypothetical protein
LLKKNGRKCKQSELNAGGEMERNEDKASEVVGLVKFSEPEACTKGWDKDESVTVGVKFLEKVAPCLLAYRFVVSGWVKTELDTMESVRVEGALRYTNGSKKCELFHSQQKCAIERSDYWGSSKCSS